MAFGSGATGARWRVTINSTLNAAAEKPRTPTLTVAGFAHPGYFGRRAINLPPLGDVPLATIWRSSVILLTGDPGAPDGAWHPDAGSFLSAFNAAATAHYGALGSGDVVRVDLLPDGSFTAGASSSTADTLYVIGGWLNPNEAFSPDPGSTYTNPFINLGQFPTAYQLFWNTVWFTASDFAQVPVASGPYNALVDSPSATFVWYTLQAKIGDNTVVAKITAADSTLNTLALAPTISTTPLTNVMILEPTAATLGAYVLSATWWSGARFLAKQLGQADGFDVIDDCFDWYRIGTIAQRTASPFPPDRSYPVDLGTTTFLDLLKNEIRLAGMIVAPYRGRIACTRITDLAANVAPDFTVYNTALRDGESPTSEDCADGLLTAFTVTMPSGQALRFEDRLAADEAGEGGEIAVTYYGGGGLSGTTGANVAAASFAQDFANLGESAIGPWRTTYRLAHLPLSLAAAGVEIGDVVKFGDGGRNPGDWIIPNDQGGRGLNGAVGQVLGARYTFFASGTDGSVDLDVRMSGVGFAGYAPECLLAAVDSMTGNVTVDDLTWGPYGFADPAGLADGGASQFVVGDVVELCEIDNATPATPFQCVITAIAGTTITVSPAPGAFWEGIAPARLKVMLAFRGNYASATNPGQHAWCWLADHTTELLGGVDNADEWAP